MKAVHISTTDYGGAYRAAANISRAMNMCGADSKVIVREKHSDEDVIPYCSNLPKLIVSKTKNLFNLAVSKGEIVNDMFGSDITDMREIREADVIILHWVNSFISYKGVRKLCSLGKPVFWVMHDMWCFTGGCHLDYGCGKYRNGCGACPILKSCNGNDCTADIYMRKEAMRRDICFTAVAPSRYMQECAGMSRMMAGTEVINIPNPVDTSLYKKEPSEHGNRTVILSGALELGQYWKGMDILAEAIKSLDPSEYCMIMTGNKDTSGKSFQPEDSGESGEHIDIEFTGHISSQHKMAELYNRADVFVIPSRQENLSNSVLEALSCGVPAVAFDIGGMSDMIQHKVNGYLARPFDIEDLLAGITYCAAHRDEMSCRAREKAETEFSMKAVGEKYVRICAEACQHNNNNL